MCAVTTMVRPKMSRSRATALMSSLRHRTRCATPRSAGRASTSTAEWRRALSLLPRPVDSGIHHTWSKTKFLSFWHRYQMLNNGSTKVMLKMIHNWQTHAQGRKHSCPRSSSRRRKIARGPLLSVLPVMQPHILCQYRFLKAMSQQLRMNPSREKIAHGTARQLQGTEGSRQLEKKTRSRLSTKLVIAGRWFTGLGHHQLTKRLRMVKNTMHPAKRRSLTQPKNRRKKARNGTQTLSLTSMRCSEKKLPG